MADRKPKYDKKDQTEEKEGQDLKKVKMISGAFVIFIHHIIIQLYI